MKTTQKAFCYLVLRWAPSTTSEAQKASRSACRAWGAKVFTVTILGAKPSSDWGPRWVLQFPKGVQKDQEAQELAESLDCSIAVTYMSLGDERVRAYRFPQSILSKDKTVSIVDLEKCEVGDAYAQLTPLDVPHAFGSAIRFPKEVHGLIWQLTPAFRDSKARRAATYLRESLERLSIHPSHLYEVETSKGPIGDTLIDLSTRETAFHTAYKAIETIIGDPPKDDDKFRVRLTTAGFNPDEAVGVFGNNKRPLIAWIREFNDARDKRVAHGSSPRTQSIGYRDVLECQGCARFVLMVTAANLVGYPLR